MNTARYPVRQTPSWQTLVLGDGDVIAPDTFMNKCVSMCVLYCALLCCAKMARWVPLIVLSLYSFCLCLCCQFIKVFNNSIHYNTKPEQLQRKTLSRNSWMKNRSDNKRGFCSPTSKLSLLAICRLPNEWKLFKEILKMILLLTTLSKILLTTHSSKYYWG